jgi:rare lipoprotein A
VQATNTPVWRATAVAAKLNQLSLEQVDASKITVKWKGESNSPQKTQRDRYIIAVNGEELVEINAETRLPDKTNDLSEDALQATNRLRRLLGNAPPLREVTGKARTTSETAKTSAATKITTADFLGTSANPFEWYGFMVWPRLSWQSQC